MARTGPYKPAYQHKMSKQSRIFKYLHTLAAQSPRVGNARISCAITSKDRIISATVNQRKTHPLQARYGKNPQSIYLHAEIAAIISALKDLEVRDFRYCDLYLARVSGVGRHPAVVQPCPGCARAIRDFGIRRVYS